MKPEMKKRSYIRAVEIKIAKYTEAYHCFVCKKKIAAKQKYYDGGWGYRAHVECVRGPFRDEKLTGIVTRGTFREKCCRCGKPATVRVETATCIYYRCEECHSPLD